MNNRTQQRFDRSIKDAIAETARANDAKPRRNLTPNVGTSEGQPTFRGTRRGWKLRLDPETGATVWGPK